MGVVGIHVYLYKTVRKSTNFQHFKHNIDEYDQIRLHETSKEQQNF